MRDIDVLELRGQRLAEYRAAYADSKALVAELENRLKDTPEYKAVESALKIQKLLQLDVLKAEDQLRRTGVYWYKIGAHEKRDYDHIGYIRETTTLKIDDEAAAVKWAVDADQSHLLSIKKGPFNKVARALELDFVTKTTTPAFAIRSDLSSLLETEDES